MKVHPAKPRTLRFQAPNLAARPCQLREQLLKALCDVIEIRALLGHRAPAGGGQFGIGGRCCTGESGAQAFPAHLVDESIPRDGCRAGGYGRFQGGYKRCFVRLQEVLLG